MTDQPTPPLHEHVRTLEADLVMCREQLAQETERADGAVKEATSPGSPLVQQADTYRRILGHPAIYTHTGLHRGRPMCMSDQIIARLDELAEAESERDEWRDRAESYRLDVAAIRDALDAPEDADIDQLIDIVHALTEQVERAQQLPEPDATNPAHLRFCAGLLALISVREGNAMASNHYGYGLPFTGNHLIDLAKHLEAAQQQADADEELVRQVGEVCRTTLSSLLGHLGITHVDRTDWAAVARDALQAAGLLQGGDEK